MSNDTETLVGVLNCQECRKPWVEPLERWRMYVLSDRRAETSLLYCPHCAAREFDGD